MEPVRERFERMAQEFGEQTERLAGVVEVAVVGSTATDTIRPGDLDFVVFLAERDAIPSVARAARRLSCHSHKWAVWLFTAADRSFLGWVGAKRQEPLVVDPNFDFDERRFLNVDPRVLWSRAGGIMTNWRNEALEKASLVGWPLPQPLTDRPLKCLACESQWTWTAHEQRIFRERGWKSPIRCHDCRPYRCGICGRKTAISNRHANEKEIFACEFCAMELEELSDLDLDEETGVTGAPLRAGDFDEFEEDLDEL